MYMCTDKLYPLCISATVGHKNKAKHIFHIYKYTSNAFEFTMNLIIVSYITLVVDYISSKYKFWFIQTDQR